MWDLIVSVTDHCLSFYLRYICTSVVMLVRYSEFCNLIKENFVTLTETSLSDIYLNIPDNTVQMVLEISFMHYQYSLSCCIWEISLWAFLTDLQLNLVHVSGLLLISKIRKFKTSSHSNLEVRQMKLEQWNTKKSVFFLVLRGPISKLWNLDFI